MVSPILRIKKHYDNNKINLTLAPILANLIRAIRVEEV